VNDGRTQTQLTAGQRRRIRRTTFLLVLVALGIYVGFIASGIVQARP
jgi:hypothetical protein